MAKVIWNEQAEPINTSLARVLYGIRTEDPDDMMLDSVVESDFYEDADEIIALDALIVPFRRLETKMLAMRRVMERNATNITVADMQTTKPFKKNGVTQIVTIFELSDGQTISIFFHNPDTTPTKLAPTDELISWKWLLNKKDVTILVAPEHGKDLNINDVCRRLLKIAEKNAPAFARANAKKAERIANIETAEKEIESLSGELKKLESDLEAQQQTISDLETAITLAKVKLPSKEDVNQAFEKAIAKNSDHQRALAGINALPLAEVVRSKFLTKTGKERGGEFEIEFLENNQIVDIRNDLAQLRVYGRSSRSQPESSYERGYSASKMRGGSLIYTDTLTVEQIQKFYEAIGVAWTPETTDENAADDGMKADPAALEIIKLLGITEPGFEKPMISKKSGVYIPILGSGGDINLDINAFSSKADAPAGQRGFMVYRWQGNDQIILRSGSVSVEDMARIFEIAGQEWKPQVKDDPAPELSEQAKTAAKIFDAIDLDPQMRQLFSNIDRLKVLKYEIVVSSDKATFVINTYGDGSTVATVLVDAREVSRKELTREQGVAAFEAAGGEWSIPNASQPAPEPKPAPATIATPEPDKSDTPAVGAERLDPQNPQFDRRKADADWLNLLKNNQARETEAEIEELLGRMVETYANDAEMLPLVEEAGNAYINRIAERARGAK